MELPTLDLKAGKDMNAAQTQDSFIMKPIDQRERTRSRNDVLTRRLKNRERQRRYRARKRLEADMKKPSIIKQSPPPQVEVQMNGFVSNYVPRVHCKRDWKKDARRARVSEYPEVTPNGCAVLTPMSTSESQTVLLSGTTAEPLLDSETHSEISVNQNNFEMHRPKLCRRDWKADARKKKN
ncbi:hypothetical protein PRUPE_5G036500 [Prunus persica]|uniref:BZIP domain-containing protein n=4 Tax=Prunus TaxID=3754 RepID=A0A5E4FYC8_PRUDU|nr:uncharacterized protein LOC117628255 isoform X1 [Prunus dulcis]KAI5327612.1 hypothetical protein L3X38_027008 [Prunus dulcis]ONI06044.1 hypothetical protein PRUPE_5G036500 [Prunus persica]VVA32403.1 Hypothetical predicted protein [Prunus dulcis]